MRVALFVPCYIDQLYPDVGLATLELLELLDHEVWLPEEVSCCGQPLINTGTVSAARPLAHGIARILDDSDVLVCPSGSCVATMRAHATRYGLPRQSFEGRIFELTEFLLERLEPKTLRLHFPHRVALHQSCHGLRELGLGQMSELVLSAEKAHESPARRLLSQVEGLTLVDLERPDECCGFGGSFCVGEPEVSSEMGHSRIVDFLSADAEVITSVDMSCLMHLSGLLRRSKRALKVMHVAQILAGRTPSAREN